MIMRIVIIEVMTNKLWQMGVGVVAIIDSTNHSERKVQNAIAPLYPLPPPLCVLYFHHMLLLGVWGIIW